MNTKYLIGFELYLMQDSYFEDEQKLSFELVQEIRKFFMKYYNVRHVRLNENSEAELCLTIEPIEVKLTSTGNDKVFKKITKNFENIYSKLCVEFDCKQFLSLLSPIYFTISPGYFVIKDERLTINRECFADLDVELNDVGMGYYNEIFKEDIEKCREYCPKYIMVHPDVEIDAEDIMF